MSPSTTTCFAPSAGITSRRTFLSGSSVEITVCPQSTQKTTSPTKTSIRASQLPPPGVPSGQDPLEGAPLRSFVPRPVETYENRSFATELPRTWEGEVTTIGINDIEPVTKESLEKARQVQVDSSSTEAFLAYSDMVREERQQALAELERRASVESKATGRPTCGEEAGREFISNFNNKYLDGVKCVEYWGVPNGPVPRLFGGPSS